MKTLLLKDDLTSAVEILKNGGLVGVPTETLYGMAANGLDAAAVEKVYEVKGRPPVKPLSLMVADASGMAALCEDIPEAAYTLAEKFWPGPLTIVLKARDVIPDIVLAGGTTLGLRCPDHPAALELVRRSGLPLTAPSANPSGLPGVKTAAEVMAYFDGKIEAVVDGGECGVGEASTLVDLTKLPYRILRAGALGEEEVFAPLVRVFGITGGTGCGKTTALCAFANEETLILDCDEIYHRLCETSAEMLSEIEARFPGTVEQGTLQRKKLGGIVFADEKALLDLNAITHRYVESEVARCITEHAKRGGKYAVIDAIALVESGLHRRCECVIGVLAPEADRVRRIMARDGISEEYARKRVRAQQPERFYRENCHHILENRGDMAAFEKAAASLYETIIIGGKANV